MNKIKSVTATLAAITLLLSATPISAATQSNSSAVIANTQASLNLDETALKRLTEAITALVGKQKVQFTSSNPGLGSDELSVEGIVKGAATAMSSQVYNKKEDRVESTILIYQASDIHKFMDNALRLKIDSFLKSFDPKETFKPDAVWRVNHPGKESGLNNYWVIWREHQSVYIDIDNNNEITASFTYALQNADASLTNKARNALKTLGISQKKAFDYVLRQQNGKDSFWNYRDDGDINHVFIGAKTGKVWAVQNDFGKDWSGYKDFNKSFAKPKLSKSQALSAASPKVKSIFGIQLKGYTVTIKENQYTFTKKGAATVVGEINKKGVFYSLEVQPSNGVRN